AIGLDPTPLELPAFRIAPLDALFVSKPFAMWLEEWLSATRTRLADERRQLFLAHRGLTPPAPGPRAAVVPSDSAAAQNPLLALEPPPDPEPIAVADSTVADSVLFLPPPPVRAQRDTVTDILTNVIGDRADLGVNIQGMANMGG